MTSKCVMHSEQRPSKAEGKPSIYRVAMIAANCPMQHGVGVKAGCIPFRHEICSSGRYDASLWRGRQRLI